MTHFCRHSIESLHSVGSHINYCLPKFQSQIELKTPSTHQGDHTSVVYGRERLGLHVKYGSQTGSQCLCAERSNPRKAIHIYASCIVIYADLVTLNTLLLSWSDSDSCSVSGLWASNPQILDAWSGCMSRLCQLLITTFGVISSWGTCQHFSPKTSRLQRLNLSRQEQ